MMMFIDELERCCCAQSHVDAMCWWVHTINQYRYSVRSALLCMRSTQRKREWNWIKKREKFNSPSPHYVLWYWKREMEKKACWNRLKVPNVHQQREPFTSFRGFRERTQALTTNGGGAVFCRSSKSLLGLSRMNEAQSKFDWINKFTFCVCSFISGLFSRFHRADSYSCCLAYLTQNSYLELFVADL